jgi:Mn2+/Fe2+ NRAMP family transporter
VRKRELVAARVDVMVGMAFSQVVMYCIILTSASALHDHGHTNVQTAQEAASSLAPLAGRFAFVIFAVGLIGTGLLAIPVLSGSAAYAIKEFLGIGGSLAIKPRHRPTFYLIIIAATLVGVGLNAVGLDPIRALFVTAVINGVVAAPLLVLIVLLGSDRSVMGSRASRGLSRVLTWVAAGLMALAAVALLVTLVRH